jgi:glucosamine-6-phosphate deaminase
MARSRIEILETPDQIGARLAERLLSEIESARIAERRYVLGCPTGRTPRPIYGAIAARLKAVPQDLSHLVLAMMDEYLIGDREQLEYAPSDKPWSCHHFARHEIVARWNAGLPDRFQMAKDAVWFPHPKNPARYETRIAKAGGIDFFILASGATDGHVAFNPPGSSRESRTRVIALSDQTRHDNLQTFPAFGSIDAVPRYGVSVGIATITEARSAVMVLTGRSKRESLRRIANAERYDPQWPATVIHEISSGEILADREAASALG